jgi:hypothetical protein
VLWAALSRASQHVDRGLESRTVQCCNPIRHSDVLHVTRSWEVIAAPSRPGGNEYSSDEVDPRTTNRLVSTGAAEDAGQTRKQFLTSITQ